MKKTKKLVKNCEFDYVCPIYMKCKSKGFDRKGKRCVCREFEKSKTNSNFLVGL